MNRELTQKVVLIAMLSALAFVITLFQIPIYGWLKLDFSFFVVLFAYRMLGVREAVAVSVLSVLLMCTNSTSPFFIGEVAALTSHLMLLTGVIMASKSPKVISYPILILGYVVFFAIFNYILMTPVYFSYGEYPVDQAEWASSLMSAFPGDWEVDSYFLAVFIFYSPFNLIKAVTHVIGFELLEGPLGRVIDEFKE